MQPGERSRPCMQPGERRRPCMQPGERSRPCMQPTGTPTVGAAAAAAERYGGGVAGGAVAAQRSNHRGISHSGAQPATQRRLCSKWRAAAAAEGATGQSFHKWRREQRSAIVSGTPPPPFPWFLRPKRTAAACAVSQRTVAATCAEGSPHPPDLAVSHQVVRSNGGRQLAPGAWR